MSNKAKVSLPIILLMTIVVIGLTYALFVRPNLYKLVGGEIQFDAIEIGQLNTNLEETVSQMGDFLYVASTEGLTKYNLKGESIWNKSYHINELQFIVEEPYMAVVDLTGKTAYIFDEEGSIAKINTDYPIVGGYLNARGYSSLVLENEQENYINLYDSKGEMVVERRTIFKDDGYPIDVALSKNGMKMMTSHLKVSQHMIESTITFLDFSSSGNEFEDRIIGHITLNETMASKLIFLDNNHGVVVSDNELNFYDTETTPSLLNKIEVGAVIEHVDQSGDLLIISYGKALSPEGEKQANQVAVYAPTGIVKEEIISNQPVTGVYGEEGTYYVIQSSKVICYESGRRQWESVAYKPIEAIYHLSADRYLLKYKYQYEVVKIRDI